MMLKLFTLLEMNIENRSRTAFNWAIRIDLFHTYKGEQGT